MGGWVGCCCCSCCFNDCFHVCVSLQCLVFSDCGLLSVLVMVTISNMFIHRIPKRPRLAVS